MPIHVANPYGQSTDMVVIPIDENDCSIAKTSGPIDEIAMDSHFVT